jgi:hypothetical protein
MTNEICLKLTNKPSFALASTAVYKCELHIPSISKIHTELKGKTSCDKVSSSTLQGGELKVREICGVASFMHVIHDVC